MIIFKSKRAMTIKTKLKTNKQTNTELAYYQKKY